MNANENKLNQLTDRLNLLEENQRLFRNEIKKIQIEIKELKQSLSKQKQSIERPINSEVKSLDHDKVSIITPTGAQLESQKKPIQSFPYEISKAKNPYTSGPICSSIFCCYISFVRGGAQF